MIYLNLLSPKKKEELEQSFIFAILGNMIEVTLIIIIVSSMILLAAKIVLKNNFEVIVAQSALINREFGAINQDIRKLNQELKNLDHVQKNYVAWSRFFTGLGKAVPTGVKLTAIAVNKNNDALTVSGFAATRANFLEFKKNINNFPAITNIESPIANLLLPRDINFTFTSKLNLSVP